MSLVNKPTRGSSYLDRIYANELCYKYVRVVSSAVKSHHCAVIAYSDDIPRSNINKQRYKRRFRQHMPAQHDQYLQYAAKDNSETTVTTADPHFVTPAVKAMLRQKNRLMRTGRVEEDAAIAKRVRSIIIKNNSVRLHRCDTRRNVRETWSKVRVITRRRQQTSLTGTTRPSPPTLRMFLSSENSPPAALVFTSRSMTS